MVVWLWEERVHVAERDHFMTQGKGVEISSGDHGRGRHKTGTKPGFCLCDGDEGCGCFSVTLVLLLWIFKSVNFCFCGCARRSYCTRCRVRGSERGIRTSSTGVCWAETTDGLSDMIWKPWPFFPTVRYSSTHQCLSMNTKIDLMGKQTFTLELFSLDPP